MEKNTPHTKLSVIKKMVSAGNVRATKSARQGAAALGFRYDQMIAVISALVLADFHKSMTSYADHTVWQDVYRPVTQYGQVYVKLTVVEDVLVVSFKEQ